MAVNMKLQASINLKKATRIGTTLGLVVASSLLGFNCGQFSSTPFSGEQTSLSTNHGPGSGMNVALLSSEQILKAMISATGVENMGDASTPEDDLIAKTYAERSGSLPSGQEMSLATGPGMISVANLASAVCAKAVGRDAETSYAQREERLFFREVNFTQGISAQDPEFVTLSFERLARNAWRREVNQSEINEIVEFAQEFSRDADLNSAATTRALATSICVAVLSSIDALTY